jgi:acyl-CoA reductase-like NAD-dependent aldehyde dehydrogenase
VIVDEDVNISKIVPSLAKGSFYHAGQVCVSTKRIYVHKNIIDKFKQDFSIFVSKLKVGDPTLKDTDVGPLIHPKEVDRVESWVNEAINEGAQLLCGGKRLSNTTYAPTILYNPPEHVKVSKEETFGPVVCVYSYEDRLEAIKRANSLPFSFQAAVFSNNINIALDTVRRLDAASVIVNDHSAYRADWMPFGGRRASGFGLGGIVDSIHDLMQNKLMLINMN